ncbi:MAG: Nif3-like dinuclear metal center hexameric protein [Gammaproteobacteria bacterium]|nr:MAG: Nif3-like dinuclear metal center hexameric protein [Gammaproteobacteria bacterium]
MVSLEELVGYLDGLLGAQGTADYAPNGLQVEGRAEVRRLVTGVSACEALLREAVAEGADAVLVHHGWFWKGEPAPVVGMRRRRLALLLRHDISLLAYHLPLDRHPQLGNNAQLGRVLGLAGEAVAEEGLLWEAVLEPPASLQALAGRVAEALGRAPLVVAAGEHPVRRLCWCTGAAQGLIPAAAARGADAFLSGEIAERTVHEARELGVHYLAAGHHATERYGVQALGEHLAQRFGLEHRYVELDNPV